MNILKLSLILFMSFSMGNVLAEVGFDSGNDFSVTPMRGSVFLYCNDFNNGRSTRYYTCSHDVISPSSHSRFVNDSEVSAKKVKLTSTWENGKVRSKTKRWSSKKGQSKRFNLWIGSLTQRPLLNYGINNIRYEMLSKSGEIEESGDFEVNVEKKPTLYCGQKVFHVTSRNGCYYPDSYCRDLFRDRGRCYE